jgi:hypothetical protein
MKMVVEVVAEISQGRSQSRRVVLFVFTEVPLQHQVPMSLSNFFTKMT